MKVILVRHADYQPLGEDPGLSDKGREHAKSLSQVIAKFIKDGDICDIWTSPTLRAYNTSEILNQLLTISIGLSHEQLGPNRGDLQWLEQMIEDYASDTQCGVLIIVTHLEYVQQFPAYLGLPENSSPYACGVVIDWPKEGEVLEAPTLIHWYDSTEIKTTHA